MPENRPYQYTGYGQVLLSSVPLRAEARHRSEMTSQLLFGEVVEVKEEKNDWYYIVNRMDLYEGWVEKYQLHPITQEVYERMQFTYFAARDTTINRKDAPVIIKAGSPLPFYEKGKILIQGKRVEYTGEVITGKHSPEALVKRALEFLHVPYLWGGKTDAGLDCSGFTQLLYTMHGYPLSRDASMQAVQGELVAFTMEMQTGDLVFFGDEEEQKITHVGIALDQKHILHAALGRVRIDILDDEGIYNRELMRYTHHLMMIKRMF